MKTAELVQLIENLPAQKKKVVEDLVTALVSDTGTTVSSNNINSGFGGAKGIISYMADDFDDPLEDFKDYM